MGRTLRRLTSIRLQKGRIETRLFVRIIPGTGELSGSHREIARTCWFYRDLREAITALSRLLDQVRESTRRLHYSIRTEDAGCHGSGTPTPWHPARPPTCPLQPG